MSERFDNDIFKRPYREKAQQYSDEKGRIWEDIRHGFIYGSQKLETG